MSIIRLQYIMLFLNHSNVIRHRKQFDIVDRREKLCLLVMGKVLEISVAFKIHYQFVLDHGDHAIAVSGLNS